MSSIPRAVERAYEEIDSEIVRNLDLGTSLTKVRAWLDNLRQLRDSAGHVDPLSRAECYLLLEGLSCSAQILKARTLGEDVSDAVVAYAREIAFLYEQFLIIHNQLKAKRASQLKKIQEGANAVDTQDVKQSSSEDPPALRMNLDNFGEPTQEQQGEKSGIYKAPTATTAISILGSNFNAEDKIQRRDKAQSAAKLSRSEFVTALTEDYTDTPTIHDNGYENLNAADRKTLKRLGDDDAGSASDDDNGFSAVIRKKQRKTDDLKKFNEIKKRQSMLRSGSEMHDLADFVKRINGEATEPDSNAGGKTIRKSKVAKSASGRKKTSKKIKKRH